MNHLNNAFSRISGKIAQMRPNAQMSINTLIAVITLVGAMATAIGATLAIQSYFGPSCPTEDSCVSDYDGNSDTWVITEVTP